MTAGSLFNGLESPFKKHDPIGEALNNSIGTFGNFGTK